MFAHQCLLWFLCKMFISRITTGFSLDFQYVVRIKVPGGHSNCAGTILTDHIILTSAHCIGRQGLPTFATQGDARPYDAEAVVIHPEYNNMTLQNDVAIFKTKRRLEPPWGVVVLASTPSGDILADYVHCSSVGWTGNGHPLMPLERHSEYNLENKVPHLVQQEITLMSHKDCQKLVADFGGSLTGKEKLCSADWGSSEECPLGPGGPVLCSPKWGRNLLRPMRKEEPYKISRHEYERTKYVGREDVLGAPLDLFSHLKIRTKRKADGQEVQIAVVSLGKSCSKLPSVYTRIDLYLSWINETIVGLCGPKAKRISVYHIAPTSASPALASAPALTTVLTYSLYWVLYRCTVFNQLFSTKRLLNLSHFETYFFRRVCRYF